MRAKIGILLAAGLFWVAAASAQDAPTIREMSPADLYATLRESEGGIRCYPVGNYDRQLHDRETDRRFRKIRPWLVAAIGEAEFEALKQHLAERLDDPGYYFGCPSDEQQARDDRMEDRVLREMERRARVARHAKP